MLKTMGNGKRLNLNKKKIKNFWNSLIIIMTITIIGFGCSESNTKKDSGDLWCPDYPPKISEKRLVEMTKEGLCGNTNASIGLLMYYSMNEEHKKELYWLQISADLGNNYLKKELKQLKKYKAKGKLGKEYDFDFNVIIKNAKSDLRKYYSKDKIKDNKDES